MPHAFTSWVFMKKNLRIILRALPVYYSRYLGIVLNKIRELVLGLIARAIKRNQKDCLI